VEALWYRALLSMAIVTASLKVLDFIESLHLWKGLTSLTGVLPTDQSLFRHSGQCLPRLG
jgi:hypothetical protein